MLGNFQWCERKHACFLKKFGIIIIIGQQIDLHNDTFIK